MILNDRQLTASEAALAHLKDSLTGLEGPASLRPDINVRFLNAQIRAVQAKIGEIAEEVERYKLLRSGQVKVVRLERLSEIGSALIEARIAAGISQRELGDRIGVAEQQVQRYEADRYRAAKLERIQAVLEALRSGSEITIRMPDGNTQHLPQAETAYPYKEMHKRGWFKSIGTKAPLPFVASQYVARNLPDNRQQALHRMKVRSNGVYSEQAMIAWKARVLELASELEPSLPTYDAIEEFDFRHLVQLSSKRDGIKQAIQFVRSAGIALVFEKHLPNTHLDGAAMLSPSGRPVVGMTVRHDREDNFWFVLLHELAHVKLHRKNGLKSGFFDDNSSDSDSVFEKEADEFALDALIPTEIWERSIVRFATEPESVKTFAAKFKISPAIVAGRVRTERKAWKKFSDLVKPGIVRQALVDIGELGE